MKKIAFLLVYFLILLNINIRAQDNKLDRNEKNKYGNFIDKGDFALNAAYITNPVSTIRDIKYEVNGVEFNAVYFIKNSIGVEVNFAAFQYGKNIDLNKKYITPDQEINSFEGKNLIMAGPRIRYNFAEKYHCATMFLQTGYSFGIF